MAKIQITKTELVWPGKYREDGVLANTPRANLPFQVIEVFTNPTRREWRNKLIWGDNLLVMGSLLEEFAGKIDLIYIDPPFATGADFSFTAAIGQQATWLTGILENQHWLLPGHDGGTSATDQGSAVSHGSLFLHCDWHVSHLLRAIGDEVFGAGELSQRNRVVLLQQISRQRKTLCVQSRCRVLVSQERRPTSSINKSRSGLKAK